MKLYWVDPQQKQAEVCRDYAKARGFLLPGDALFLVCLKERKAIAGLCVLDSDLADPAILFLHVGEKYRHQGIGKSMIGEIMKAARDAGMNSVRCTAYGGTGADTFLQKCGFALFPGPVVYRTTMGALRYSGQYRANIDNKSPGKVCPLSCLKKLDRDILKGFFDRENLAWEEGYDGSTSVVRINDGKVSALILCDRRPKGILFRYAYSENGDPAPLRKCLRALNMLILAGEDQPEDLVLYFDLDASILDTLIRELAGEDIHIMETVTTTIAVKLL